MRRNRFGNLECFVFYDRKFIYYANILSFNGFFETNVAEDIFGHPLTFIVYT